MPDDLSAQVVAALTAGGETIAVAESLTGGALVAELIKTPGASVVVNGGIVAYRTAVKHTLLGVDSGLLARHGAVHPEVAAQMAVGARRALAVGRRAGLHRTVDDRCCRTGSAGRPPGRNGVPRAWPAATTCAPARSGSVAAATRSAAPWWMPHCAGSWRSSDPRPGPGIIPVSIPLQIAD